MKVIGAEIKGLQERAKLLQHLLAAVETCLGSRNHDERRSNNMGSITQATAATAGGSRRKVGPQLVGESTEGAGLTS